MENALKELAAIKTAADMAEALGVSQPTAWRMGHVLRLMVLRDQPLGGTVEVDQFHFGGKPPRDPDRPKPGRGRKGQPHTAKTPAMVVVQRPASIDPGSPAGEASVIADLSLDETERVLKTTVDPDAHLMSDEWKAFVSAGTNVRAHDTVYHSKREYARGDVHANSADGGRVRPARHANVPRSGRGRSGPGCRTPTGRWSGRRESDQWIMVVSVRPGPATG